MDLFYWGCVVDDVDVGDVGVCVDDDFAFGVDVVQVIDVGVCFVDEISV